MDVHRLMIKVEDRLRQIDEEDSFDFDTGRLVVEVPPMCLCRDEEIPF